MNCAAAKLMKPDTESPTELIPIPCRICKAPVAVELPPEDSPYRATLERTARLAVVHDECLDRHRAVLKAAQLLANESARLTSWNTLCPAEYRKPIDWKKKAANRASLEKVMAWTYGERGLFVHGQPGRCKTRFVWQLLAREWDKGRAMSAHLHSELRALLTAVASAEQARFLSFIQNLSRVPLLFIDDLGKGRSTPASEEALFDVLDYRFRNCLPTLFTSEWSLKQLEAHFSEEYCRGLARRIGERCQEIEF